MNKRRLLLILFMCMYSKMAQAAQYLDHGDHRIHYTTFSSMIIPPDVASAHGIVRSEQRIILNLSVLKLDQPISVLISGHVTNLLNQRFKLTFSEVAESDSLYYLAHHQALEHDTLRYNLLVELTSGEGIPIKFLRRYD